LKGCFGVPIRASSEVLAVLVFCKRDRSIMEPRIVELVKALATQLGDHLQRKQAEEELRKSEERWQLVLKGNQDGIWDLNLQTNEVFRSARWQEIIGYADGEIDSSSSAWIDHVHPDDRSRVQAAIQDYLDRQTPITPPNTACSAKTAAISGCSPALKQYGTKPAIPCGWWVR
jgi:two-component system sensor histidine kinase/response regulator